MDAYADVPADSTTAAVDAPQSVKTDSKENSSSNAKPSSATKPEKPTKPEPEPVIVDIYDEPTEEALK